jgi:CheY-like chemotaxis protein/signal transduction histidine kinase
MNNDYRIKKVVYFAIITSVILAIAVYLWCYQADVYAKKNIQFNTQLTSLKKMETLNNELNDLIKPWPLGFNKESTLLFETKLNNVNELINENGKDNISLEKSIKKNREYWLLLADYSLNIDTLSAEATASFYTVLNRVSNPSKSLLTIITRMPAQHNAFTKQHSLIAYAAIKRDVELLKKLLPNIEHELDRYLDEIDKALAQVSLMTPILAKLQASRFERDYDLNYHLKTLIDQNEISLNQLQLKEKSHQYYLFVILIVFVSLFLFKLYSLVKYIEIIRVKSEEVERYASRKVKQYKLAEQAKSNFLMIISYEARTALDVIMGLTKFVSEQKISEIQKSKLTQVSSTSKKLNSLLNDVLELIDLDMNTVELDSEVFSPKNVLELLNKKYEEEAKGSHVLFEALIDKSLDGTYIGDQGRFYQLIDYLLSNSFTSTEQGHVSFTVNLDTGRGLSDQYQRINFLIEDTGIKPSTTEVNTLFESFSMTKFQASRKSGGEGVRLSIIKSLVRLMKGEIEASHSGSTGMKYNLHVYLEKSNSGEEPLSVNSLQEKPALDHIIEIPSLNILIVEDSSVNAFLLKWILEGFKHNVTIAKNGIECLNLVDSADFDLIFMDQYMPEMNGAQATEKIRALTSDKAQTPIIGCTADAFQETRQELIEAGQNDIIIKPITNTVVADVIQKYLQGGYKIPPLKENDEVKESKE